MNNDNVNLTTKEAARRLRVAQETVQFYVRTGQLPAAKVGRQYLVTPADLAAFITARRK